MFKELLSILKKIALILLIKCVLLQAHMIKFLLIFHLNLKLIQYDVLS